MYVARKQKEREKRRVDDKSLVMHPIPHADVLITKCLCQMLAAMSNIRKSKGHNFHMHVIFGYNVVKSNKEGMYPRDQRERDCSSPPGGGHMTRNSSVANTALHIIYRYAQPSTHFILKKSGLQGERKRRSQSLGSFIYVFSSPHGSKWQQISTSSSTFHSHSHMHTHTQR